MVVGLAGWRKGRNVNAGDLVILGEDGGGSGRKGLVVCGGGWRSVRDGSSGVHQHG